MRLIICALLAIGLASTLSACGGAYTTPQAGIQSDIDASVHWPASSTELGSPALARISP
jgi:hypothetical protein